MPSSLFDLFDDNLCETTLSFCDFNSAVCAGRTCQRLKKISDNVLDKWADKILLLESLPIAGDDRIMFDKEAYGKFDERSTLRDGWGPNLRTKRDLLKFALCQHKMVVNVGDASLRIDLRKAARLLHSHGSVDALDLVDCVPPEYNPDTDGYNITIKFKEHYSLNSAVQFIRGVYCGGFGSKACGANDERLRHATFCILRKCILRDDKPLRLKFATYEGVHRDPRISRSRKLSSLMILVDDREIELFSETNGLWLAQESWDTLTSLTTKTDNRMTAWEIAQHALTANSFGR